MPEVKPTTVSSENPQSYEDAHVHAVYDEIAPHFSSTRYKASIRAYGVCWYADTSTISHGQLLLHFLGPYLRVPSVST